jgi:hypothetical protein
LKHPTCPRCVWLCETEGSQSWLHPPGSKHLLSYDGKPVFWEESCDLFVRTKKDPTPPSGHDERIWEVCYIIMRGLALPFTTNEPFLHPVIRAGFITMCRKGLISKSIADYTLSKKVNDD